MRRSILACGLLLAFAGMATAAAAATASKNSEGSPSTTTSTTVATTESRQGPSRWELRKAAVWRRHIRRLRKALNASDRTDLLRTVRSVGYALDKED